jgi:hypothetical protein
MVSSQLSAVIHSLYGAGARSIRRQGASLTHSQEGAKAKWCKGIEVFGHAADLD